MDRRQFLSLMAGVASWRALHSQPALAQDKSLSHADMHSHIGVLGGHADVRETMMRNGVLVISRNIVSDAPVIRRIPGKGIQQVRQPAAGELASRFDLALERMRAEHKEQSLIEITDSVSLERVMSARVPGVVLTAEGGDFLDGDLKRLEGARRNGLVHLQLLHYRVSELGDISTELPVHNGLTVFGREVVSACNRLGILIDVAHATSEGIVQALDISSKPMIYSHGHVTSSGPHWTYGGIRARGIHAPLARRIAAKGGVIGIWPLSLQYRSLEAYTTALLDTAETVGVAHVGIGTDMFGLGGSTVIPGYEQLPQIAELLARRGLGAAGVAGIMGANYLRVLKHALEPG